jgi:hypothetical protein
MCNGYGDNIALMTRQWEDLLTLSDVRNVSHKEGWCKMGNHGWYCSNQMPKSSFTMMGESGFVADNTASLPVDIVDGVFCP